MIGAMMAVQAQNMARRPGLGVAQSRIPVAEEPTRARCRVYKFGEHLKQGHAGNGVLTSVPNTADTDVELIKGMLLRAAYGDSVDFEMLDFNTVWLYLLPDGEELLAAGEALLFDLAPSCRHPSRTAYPPHRPARWLTPSHHPCRMQT